jgi:hypothetical protein
MTPQLNTRFLDENHKQIMGAGILYDTVAGKAIYIGDELYSIVEVWYDKFINGGRTIERTIFIKKES